MNLTNRMWICVLKFTLVRTYMTAQALIVSWINARNIRDCVSITIQVILFCSKWIISSSLISTKTGSGPFMLRMLNLIRMEPAVSMVVTRIGSIVREDLEAREMEKSISVPYSVSYPSMNMMGGPYWNGNVASRTANKELQKELISYAII